jgi:putative FmdB family regulatory protein
MPTYEYQCQRCGEVFSRERRIPDRKKPVKCRGCGSRKSELLLSCCSFALVGDGWAASGYSTRGPKTK